MTPDVFWHNYVREISPRLTQTEMAERMGVTLRTVQHWDFLEPRQSRKRWSILLDYAALGFAHRTGACLTLGDSSA